MKKLVIGTVLVVIVAIVILALVSHHNKAAANLGGSTTNSTYVIAEACDVMTKSVATQILGNGAMKTTTPANGESTSDIAFSNCVYSASPNVDPPHMASVAVRSAKDSAGASSNNSVFTSSGEPANAQTVAGYGSKAYWDPGMGQLNILKGNNWYILTNYTGTSPANGTATLVMAEQLAQTLMLR